MPLEIYALSPEKMELREYESAKSWKRDRMKVQSLYAAAKHGTELSGIKGDSAKRGPYDPELQVFPNTGKGRSSRTGNMFVGTVIGEGVDGFAEGDVVLSYGPFRETHVISTARCWKVPRRVFRGNPRSVWTRRILPCVRSETDRSESETP